MKPDRSVRMCGDFEVSVNTVAKVADKYVYGILENISTYDISASNEENSTRYPCSSWIHWWCFVMSKIKEALETTLKGIEEAGIFLKRDTIPW